jgi:hypothetical protein
MSRPRGVDIERSAINRASATDLAFLAMDGGRVPQQIVAVLLLGGGRGLDLPPFPGYANGWSGYRWAVGARSGSTTPTST